MHGLDFVRERTRMVEITSWRERQGKMYESWIKKEGRVQRSERVRWGKIIKTRKKESKK